MKHTMLALFALTLALPVRAHAQDDVVARTQSFEDGMPAFVSVAKGRVSLSEAHVQEGRQSLRWDWVAGDTLTFNTGPLGMINVRTGYGGYSRSAFAIHIYTETLGPGALSFRWMAGDRAGAHFEIPLVFKGWQRICYHYSWDSKLKDRLAVVLEKTDRIIVEAPKQGAGGTVYFDSIDFNKPFDFRDGREPVATLWKPFDLADCKDPAILAPPSQKELAAVAQLLAALAAPGNRTVTEKDALATEKKLGDKYALERRADGTVAGKITPNFSASVGGDLSWIAHIWLAAGPATDPKIRTRIENAYFLLDDFFRESGAVAQGNLKDLSWYGGREHGSACFIMREPLRRTGRLERVRNCLKYHWNYDIIFKSPDRGQAMGTDYFYIDTHYLMRIALMHDTPAAVVSHLRAFTRRYNLDILNTIEPDGSIYHHGFYNFPYVTGGMASMASQINQLSTTPFAVSQQAFEKAKLAAMKMRWFCNLTDSPIFMHGRHPGRLRLSEGQYLALAEAGRAHNAGKLDRSLAAAYLRVAPAQASKPAFTAQNITPEPAPQGNVAMNYAALMGQRRGEWLAVVRGYSKYLPAQESYANANRHGLFLGNGYLDILASGSPINLIDSGCDIAKGWDWRHLDGTTSYFAPYARIANGNGTMGETSDVAFVGGLSNGTNGVFAMPLHSRFQYTKSLPEGKKPDPKGFFTANKSYFFFDHRIVCLGSDIALSDSPYEVRTTLFQKHLKEAATPIGLDGKPIAGLPADVVLDADRAHTLMDIQETGYYLPPGQKTRLTRQHQTSRDGHDQKDTQGDHATAWIDHGINPAGAGYRYVVLVKTTPPQLAAFAAAMAESEKPIVIGRQDSVAHIVLDRSSRTWGAVFFAATADPALAAPAGFPVTGVSQPCLLMIQTLAPGKLAVSAGDPDLHVGKRVSAPITLTFTLAGAWKLAADDPQVKATTAGNQTTLRIACVEGRSFTFELQRPPGG